MNQSRDYAAFNSSSHPPTQSRAQLQIPKRSVVTHLPFSIRECSVDQFLCHPDFRRDVVLAGETELHRRNKSEARVVVRVANNNDCGKAVVLRMLKARLDESGSNTAALSLWHDSHRA